MPPAPKTEEDKQKLIEQFRAKTSKYASDEYWNTDDYICKWLELKTWSVDRAETGFRKMVQWRAKNKMGEILEENFDDMREIMPFNMDGVDKEGRPVITISCANCYPRQQIELGHKDRVKRFVYFIAESAYQYLQAKFLAKEIKYTSVVLIADAAGVDISSTSPKVITTLVEATRTLEENYPGMILVAYAVNASKPTEARWDALRPLHQNKFLSCMTMYGEECSAEYEAKVLDIIEPGQLRRRFGGSRQDEVYKERVTRQETLEEIYENVQGVGS